MRRRFRLGGPSMLLVAAGCAMFAPQSAAADQCLSDWPGVGYWKYYAGNLVDVQNAYWLRIDRTSTCLNDDQNRVLRWKQDGTCMNCPGGWRTTDDITLWPTLTLPWFSCSGEPHCRILHTWKPIGTAYLQFNVHKDYDPGYGTDSIKTVFYSRGW
jgi:hypothetical protein